MYDIIYQFIYGSIFNSTSLNSFEFTIGTQTIDLNVWLSHTFTIISMIILLVCAFVFLRWLFRVVSGLFLLK